jgi:phosphatidylinositol alpha-1,6-mannosyltransferase
MRLLVVTQDFPPACGGIPRYVRELSERLLRRVETLVVLAPRAPGDAALDAALPFEVERAASRADLLGILGAPHMLRMLRRHRIDASFHAQWMTAPAALAARAVGCLAAVAIAAHGREILLEPWGPLEPAYDALRRHTLSAADRVLPVSRYTAGLVEALGVERERIAVIPNGAPIAARASTPRRRHLILTVARLVRRKGIDTMLDAMPRILERMPDARYLVVGDGPERERLADRARRFGDRVELVGAVDESALADCYRACDLFVMPAWDEPPDVEGFGLVFLEAGAAEKPVIGSLAGGIPDAVAEGVSGLLVPPRDPQALAEAVLRLLDDEALAMRMGAAGRARANAWTWEHVAERLHDELERALDNRPVARSAQCESVATRS